VAELPDTGAPPKGKGNLFTKKWHGVPVSVLFAGGGVALYFGYRWYKNRQSSSSTTTPSTTSTGDTTGTGTDTSGLGSGGGGSSGGGGYGGSGDTPAWVQQLETAIAGITPAAPTGVVTTLTPQPLTPGTTQVPYGTVVNNPGGGTDQAAVTALTNAEAALTKAKASGNKTAIANATKNLAGAEAAVNARDSAAGVTTTAPPIPAASKTTPTGLAAQQAPTAMTAAQQAVIEGPAPTNKATATTALEHSH
jgi:hypothetical protein